MFSTHIDMSQWITASAAMLVLLTLFALAVRYVAHKQPQTALGMKKRRLSLKETLHLDARTKVCIVEQDEMEHTIVIGQNGQTVISTNPIKATTEVKDAKN